MNKGPPKSDVLRHAKGLTPGIAQGAKARRDGDRARLERAIHRPPPRNDLSSRLSFEYRSCAELQKAARQLRKLSADHFEELKGSIEQFGPCGAVLISQEGEIIDGHRVVDACRAAGIEEVPCLIVGHLSKREIRALRISVNRIQEKGTWDFDALSEELKELAAEFGPDLHIPGIEFPELDALLLDDEGDQASELDELPVVVGETVTRLFDTWGLGPHIIGCGDARDTSLARAILVDRRVRLNFSDFPYNVPISGHVTRGNHREFVMASGEMTEDQFLPFLTESLAAMREFMFDGALAMVFMDWRGLRLLLEAGRRGGFSLLNIVVWIKTNAGMGSLYRSQHEFVVLFKKGNAPHVNNIELGKHGRWRSNVWYHAGASSMGSEAREELKNHPTPKPVRLLEDAILDVTNRGDLIFDSFAGSGSTLIAAERTGRVFGGTELDPAYVDVILCRWSKLTGETPVLRETDETFEEVKIRRLQESEPGNSGCQTILPETLSQRDHIIVERRES
ncbi:hypothetical protein BH10PSE7_BH10PSE7_31410 [soil metagenome]